VKTGGNCPQRAHLCVTISCTVSVRSITSSWGTNPTHFLTERGLTGVVEFKKMLPEDASSLPAMQCKSVVLPLPEGPMIA
jgi:hypothetical protein